MNEIGGYEHEIKPSHYCTLTGRCKEWKHEKPSLISSCFYLFLLAVVVVVAVAAVDDAFAFGVAGE